MWGKKTQQCPHVSGKSTQTCLSAVWICNKLRLKVKCGVNRPLLRWETGALFEWLQPAALVKPVKHPPLVDTVDAKPESPVMDWVLKLPFFPPQRSGLHNGLHKVCLTLKNPSNAAENVFPFLSEIGGLCFAALKGILTSLKWGYIRYLYSEQNPH